MFDSSSRNTPLIDQLQSIFVVARQDTQSQMELALAWNCIDVAKEDIFNVEKRISWQVSLAISLCLDEKLKCNCL
jgi:hypothetical protein